MCIGNMWHAATVLGAFICLLAPQSWMHCAVGAPSALALTDACTS